MPLCFKKLLFVVYIISGIVFLGTLSIIIFYVSYQNQIRKPLYKVKNVVKENMPRSEVHQIIVSFSKKYTDEIDITTWHNGMGGTKPWKLRETYIFKNWPLDSYIIIYYNKDEIVSEILIDE